MVFTFGYFEVGSVMFSIAVGTYVHDAHIGFMILGGLLIASGLLYRIK